MGGVMASRSLSRDGNGPNAGGNGPKAPPGWLPLSRRPAPRVRQAFLAFALRSRTIVCREGVYYLLLLAFVFAGATLGDVNLLMLLAGMLVGPVWLSWRLVTKTLRGIQVRRQMPRGVCAGDLL